MAFLVFNKNNGNNFGSLYNIVENENDLNLLNIIKEDYITISISPEDFFEIKLNIKSVVRYENNSVIYENLTHSLEKEDLLFHLEILKTKINNFLKNNKNHSSFDKWNNYLNQLNSFNVNSLTFPLTKSFEKHLFDSNQTVYNILQVP
jgi:hypothetical protein